MRVGQFPFFSRWQTLLTLMTRTVNSTLYTFTYDQIIPEFGISREVATLGLSIFVVGLAIGPMFLAPLSEASRQCLLIP